ncbi:MAG TPA: lysoplasmalogenase [Phnomibacter sp.]|nr:lysoplasmalogenase [Phnomibacter sp.]
MHRTANRVLSFLFFACLAVDLCALHWQIECLHITAKPLLMPVLIGMLLSAPALKTYALKKLIVAALLFSWIGDCALLRGEQPLFFIAGLVSFLIAHVFYILYFHRHRDKAKKWSLPVWMILLIGVYSVGLFLYLLPSLGSMKIPVAIYTAIITLMLIKAISSKKQATVKAYLLFVGGAICFVLSDSALAINKFAQPFATSSFVIMITYGLAQWLLVQGSIQQGVQDAAKNNY